MSTSSPARTRLARAGRRALRGLAAVAALVLVLLGGVYALTARRFTRHVAVPSHAAPSVAALSPTPAAREALVARGAHVVAVRGCTECHGANFGGATIVDNPLIGRLGGPNLTAGGRGPALDDRAWELALRHGVRPGGRPLLVMPSAEYAGMSDEDVAAVAAYVRSLRAVGTPSPALQPGPLLRVLYTAGKADMVAAASMPQRTAHAAALAPAPTVAYGAYVATSCSGCHRADFAGGPIAGAPPDWPPAANITPHPTAGLGRWTAADFDRLLATGVRRDGRRVDTAGMPVRMTRALNDVERRALWAYLRTVPAKETLR
ncbi:cytochrome c [Gemmatimonadetes bacterium T265]|nr:cytochrome c [Gemmatimonadetes bacterium T265]